MKQRRSIGLVVLAGLGLVGLATSVVRGPRGAGEAAFVAADGQLRHAASTWPWTGNDPRARALAEQFGRRLQDRKVSAFGGGEEAWFAHQASLIHCELRPGGACFLVNVIDDVDGPTRDAVLAIAWRTAREITSESLAPEERLAVGLRSDRGYLAIASGRGSDAAPPRLPGVSTDELAGFFAPERATTAAAATPGE